MGEKGKLFLIVECNEYRVTENHHFVTIIVMTDSGKNNKWKLKPVGETLMRNRTFI